MKKRGCENRTRLEEYEDAMFRLSMWELAVEEAEAVEAQELPPDILRHAEAEYPRMQKIIRRNVSSNNIFGIFKMQSSKAVRIAAVFAIAVTACLTFAIATSGFLHKDAIEFKNEEYEGHNVAAFYETGETVDVPIEWTGSYYPVYIPEGFTVENIHATDYEWSINFTDGKYNNILFMIFSDGTRVNYNTEKCEVYEVDINGAAATVTVYDNIRCMVVWHVGDKGFLISSTLSPEETIRIATSVKLIK